MWGLVVHFVLSKVFLRCIITLAPLHFPQMLLISRKNTVSVRLCENMMKLAKTKKFSREDHPLLFSKALSNTLQFRQQVVSTPNVLILDFRDQVELQTGSYLGSYINLSDLLITKKRNNCFTTHYYLSSVFTTDRTGGYATFSFHSELSIWIGYNGHNVIQVS